MPRQGELPQGVGRHQRGGLEAHVVALEHGGEPVEVEQVPVEVLEQPAHPFGDRGCEVGLVDQREAQALVRHQPREMLVDAPAVADHQAHAVREVRGEVLVGEEVEVRDLRPRESFEVGPAPDRTRVLIGPRAHLVGTLHGVRGLEVALGERQADLVAHHVVPEPEPELDEVVEVRALRRAVGPPRGPGPAEQAGHDGPLHHVVDEVLDERRDGGTGTAHQGVGPEAGVGCGVPEGKDGAHASEPPARYFAVPEMATISPKYIVW